MSIEVDLLAQPAFTYDIQRSPPQLNPLFQLFFLWDPPPSSYSIHDDRGNDILIIQPLSKKSIRFGWLVVRRIISWILLIIFFQAIFVVISSIMTNTPTQLLELIAPILPFIILLFGLAIPQWIIGKFIGEFEKYQLVQSPDGTQMGEIIKTDSFGNKWKILDPFKEKHASISIYDPSLRISGKYRQLREAQLHTGEVQTTFGVYKAEASYQTEKRGEKRIQKTTECSITDSNDNLSFIVKWLDFIEYSKSGREYRIDSYGTLTPFLVCSISICLIERFLTRYREYRIPRRPAGI